jgi:MoxR-like ATPase
MSQDTGFVPRVKARVAEVVVGQDTVVERMMIALLTGGHLLLIGVPGIAKTLLVNAVAKAVDLKFSRVQFTIDMLPSDILGSEILDQSTGKFRTHQGPVFTNLLLADEINRAAPKVQSALLEAMQERKVTIGNTSYRCRCRSWSSPRRIPSSRPAPSNCPRRSLTASCFATGLPIRPRRRRKKSFAASSRWASSDRRRRDAEDGLRHDLRRRSLQGRGFDQRDGSGAEDSRQRCVHEAHRRVRPTDAHTSQHRTRLLAACRSGHRASLAGTAFVQGRDYVVPEDLFELAEDVVLHRIRLSYEALAEGQKSAQVLEESLKKLG